MTRRSLPLYGGISAVALALAFLAGRWHGQRTLPVHASSPGSIAAADRKSVPQPPPAPTIARERNDESRRFARRMEASTGSLAAEDERQRLIEQWAAIDPQAALAYARTRLRGDRQAQAMSAAIAIWGKNEPAAAWDWVSREMPEATHHFDTLLEVFGRQSSETAAHYAKAYSAAHPEAALEVHLAALLGVTYRGDFGAARAMVEGNTALDPAVRANLGNFIAGQWARFAPTEAAAWAMTLPAGPQRDQALIGLGESWSEVDPAHATEFAARLPAGETRALAMRQAISKWVESDPEAARGWVLKTEHQPDFDQAVESIATQNNFMNREPARAIRWAEAIFDDTIRVKTLNRILFTWFATDAAAATTYLQASPEFTAEQRAKTLEQLKAAHPAE